MSIQKTIEALRSKAEAGNPGAMLEYGQTLGRDDPSSLGWFERAEAAGSSAALISLGWAWEKGFHGATRDLAKALTFYEKALAAGHTELGPIPLAKHIKALKTKLKRSTATPPRS